ncbi:NusA-like transcription termination signal-binding factor [Candidatus Woesearchaeota archaeon CG_4_10_14_0_2_um_filter_33_13]|nr:MAG: NusA-like transcription termination signal-binding factor [Candidatus Woesearchaeota archaeon CG_4_10_14_0_2_um_filter_33_13]
MVRLKLDSDTPGLAAVMERITRARVKDCFKDEDTIYFIVGVGELGKAVGKGGVNIKRVQQELGKRIKVVEFRDTLKEFVKNVIYPATVEEIIEEGNIVTLKDSSKKTKSLLIGREGKNLKLINRAVKRFFNVEEIKVI